MLRVQKSMWKVRAFRVCQQPHILHPTPPTFTASFLSVGLMRLPPSPRASSRCSCSEVSRSRTCVG